MAMTFRVLLLAGSAIVAAGSARADVALYVDAAPNVYGSPLWPAWQSNAYSTAADGTFVNMANSSNPSNIGTTNFSMIDHVVYSFGDLGRRLHFVYWIPGETIASLAGRFDIRMDYVWDGISYDFYNDYYGSTWLTPSSWTDYDANGDTVVDGVIGSAGFAYWGAYGVNTPEALAADFTAWRNYLGDITFTARLDGQETMLQANYVPEPASLALLGVGLMGLAIGNRRRQKRLAAA